MRVADSDYILALHNGAKVVNYATFTFADGRTKTLEPSNFRISGNTFTDKTTDGNSFSVGSFIGKTVNICIDNTTGEFDEYDFYMSKFILKESIQINSTTVKHVVISEFTVVTDITPGAVIRFSGVDSSYKFDKKHNLTGSKTFKQIVSLACENCLGSSNFDATGNFELYSLSVDTSKIDANTTWRQIITYVATAAGYNAYIDPTGLLKFKWYDTSVWHSNDLDGGTFDTNTTPYSDGDTADGGDFTFSESTNYDGGTFTDVEDYHIIQSYKNLQLGTYDISITGVRVINGDTVVESSSSHQYNYSYIIEVKNNPLCEGIESTIASHLAGKLNDFTFRIFNCGIACDPLIEAGDMALVIDTKGIAHRTIINEVQFTTGGFTQIACKAESIIRQQGSYTSEAAKAVVEANRRINTAITSYDASVQRMNELAQNALGMYTAAVKLSDDSVIRYESDHVITYDIDGGVIFTPHSFVCKNAGTGYFYSTDAGLTDATTTWTGGMDRNGNAVLNTISVYKLQAEWIGAGILDVGGNGTNAVIRVNDANGNPICYINQQGIIMYRGLIQDANGTNYWNLTNGAFSLASSVKVNIQTPDYTGTVDPTLSNYPASSWSDYDDHVGETYKNTVSSDCFVFKKNENGGSLKIKFSNECATENNYDYVEIYYVKNGTYYKRVFTGSFGGAEVYIPTATFFLLWHTDSSVNNYGWSIDSFEVVDYQEPTGFSATSAPSASEQVLVTGTSTQTQSEHPYTANIDRLYVWETQLSLTYCWAESTLDEYSRSISELIVGGDLTQEEVFNALTNNGADQCIKMDGYGHLYVNAEYVGVGVLRIGGINYAQNAHIEVRDTSDNVVGTWDKDGFSANRGSFGRLVIDSSDSSMYVLGHSQFYRSTTRSAVTAASATVNGKIPSYVASFKIKTTFTGVVASGQSYADGTQAGTVNIQRSSGGSYSTIETLAIKFNEEVESDVTITGTDLQNYSYRVVVTLNNVTTYLSSCARAVVTSNYKVLNISETGVKGNFEGEFAGSAILTDVKVGNQISLNVLNSEERIRFKTGSGSTTSCMYLSSGGIHIYGGYDISDSPYDGVYIREKFDSYLQGGSTQGFMVGYYSSSSTNQYNIMTGNHLRYVSGGTVFDYQRSSSDERTKNDINDLPPELSVRFIDETQPKSFRYNGDEELKHYGMIAQDARAILDNLGEDDAGLEYSMGDTNIPDQRNIVYQEYIPHLINYVKDLRKELDAVKAELKELKGE